jgi:Ca2+-binding RTX toxin-like protein
MVIVHFMQATNMSLLPTSLPGSVTYEPPSGSSETRLVTYDRGTVPASDDVRLGLYGSSPGVTEIEVSALHLDLADGDSFPNLFVDGLALSLTSGQPPLKTGNILALFQTALADADTVTGSERNDTINAFGGNDTIDGRGGADKIIGGAGDDHAFGGTDADLLLGLAGNDILFGQAGSDDLRGGLGDDVYNGGGGRDLLRGDAGADRFDFDQAAESGVGSANRDIIMGFNRSQGDRIDLSTIDANTHSTAPNNQAFEFIGTEVFTGNADDPQKRGEIRIVDTGSDIRILGNIDGDRAPELEILVKGIAELDSGDFIF